MIGQNLIVVLACLCATVLGNVPDSFFDIDIKYLDGEDMALHEIKNLVAVLVVNVASQCGHTEEKYRQMNTLEEEFGIKGLMVLAAPCNQFGGQEPGTAEEIMSWAEEKEILFDFTQKLEVNGPNAHPMYKFLKARPEFSSDIAWNFEAFLVNPAGQVIERFGTQVDLTSPDVRKKLEAVLEQVADPEPYGEDFGGAGAEQYYAEGEEPYDEHQEL